MATYSSSAMLGCLKSWVLKRGAPASPNSCALARAPVSSWLSETSIRRAFRCQIRAGVWGIARGSIPGAGAGADRCRSHLAAMHVSVADGDRYVWPISLRSDRLRDPACRLPAKGDVRHPRRRGRWLARQTGVARRRPSCLRRDGEALRYGREEGALPPRRPRPDALRPAPGAMPAPKKDGF